MKIAELSVFVILLGVVSVSSQINKVLVTNFYFGWHHNEGRALNVALLKQIGLEEGFDVEIVESDSELTSSKLDSSDVLIIQNLSGTDSINDNAKAAINKFVEEDGKGIFGIHLDMVNEWDWVKENGVYTSYNPPSEIQPADIKIDSQAYDTDGNLHPILTGIDQYEGVDLESGTISGWTEEWLNWDNFFRDKPNLTVLLNMNTQSYDCNCNYIEDDHPALWITEQIEGEAGGSFSHFIVGHGPEIHQCQLSEYENNAGAGCNQLLKHIWKNIILYQGGELASSRLIGRDKLGNVRNPASKYNRIKIYDSDGKLVKNIPLLNDDSFLSNGLEYSKDLLNGVYFIKYDSKNESKIMMRAILN